MKIRVKGVSNGYVVTYDKTDCFGYRDGEETAVHTSELDLMQFLGELIYKEYVKKCYDNVSEIDIEVK